MDAQVNVAILESIFYKNSPLHDGAIIIRDNYIVLWHLYTIEITFSAGSNLTVM